MAKIAYLSANLGGFDQPVDPVAQELPDGMELTFRRITDNEFPLRSKSMTPRLQARIVKMHTWQFLPGYDYYLWVDSSCTLPRPDSARWFLNQLGDNDIAVFKHPNRNTVQEEADYVKHRLSINCPYVTPRYENELIDEQLAEVDPDQELYASTAFIFRDSPAVREAMKNWWYHTSRYHSIDQLSFPFVLSGLKVKVIPDSYTKCAYLEFTRNRR